MVNVPSKTVELKSVYANEAKFREDLIKTLQSLVDEVKKMNKKIDEVNKHLDNIAFSVGTEG